MQRADIDGISVAYRRAEGDGTPVLFVHGVPDSSDLWLPFLERVGGVAPDLPGFGRSDKPPSFPYSIEGYATVLERFCDQLGLERVRLVCHDWGAVGLAFAQRRPERVERIVAIDVVPFLAGYRWHKVARAWRTPVVGELTMGFTTRGALQRAARMPREWAEQAMAHFDHGTQRAILRLYRASDPEVLAAAGERLHALAAPALVLWGERDPYLPERFGRELARTLPHATFELIDGAGHWPWVDDTDALERAVAFLAQG